MKRTFTLLLGIAGCASFALCGSAHGTDLPEPNATLSEKGGVGMESDQRAPLGRPPGLVDNTVFKEFLEGREREGWRKFDSALAAKNQSSQDRMVDEAAQLVAIARHLRNNREFARYGEIHDELLRRLEKLEAESETAAPEVRARILVTMGTFYDRISNKPEAAIDRYQRVRSLLGADPELDLKIERNRKRLPDKGQSQSAPVPGMNKIHAE